METEEGGLSRRVQTLGWLAAGIGTALAAIFLVTGLIVPGFLTSQNRSSALSDAPSGATKPDRSPDLPWAREHPGLRKLAPDAAVARLARTFVGRINAGRAAAAVEMVCPDKRRVIRDSVTWTAAHTARLRLTTPLDRVARPRYVALRFAGVVHGRERRGTIGLDAGPTGRPSCVSAFYSVD